MKSVVLFSSLLLASITPAPALFGLFEDDAPRQAPAPAAQAGQDARADALRAQADAAARAGDGRRAARLLEEVVDQYPFSRSAGEAQFSLGLIENQRGRHEKASEAYQRVLTRYPNSGRFGDALNAQFRLAEAARLGQVQTSFMGLARNYDRADVQAWYQAVINAAPRSELAAPSLMAIGQMQVEANERQGAIDTLQRLVREYPESKVAPQAQLLLAEVLGGSAGGRTGESRTLEAQQEALNDLNTLYGDDPAMKAEAETRLGEVSGRQAANDLEIAQFYERRGNLRAASIYYREVLRYEGTPEYDTAQARLAQLGVQDGPIGSDADAQMRALAADGHRLTSRRPDYVGPPAPDLAAAEGSPMRLDPGLLDLDDLPDIAAPGDGGAGSSLFIDDSSSGSMPELGSEAGTTEDPSVVEDPAADAASKAEAERSGTSEGVRDAEEALRRAREAVEELRRRNAERDAAAGGAATQGAAAEETPSAEPSAAPTAAPSADDGAETATSSEAAAAPDESAAAPTENSGN